MAAPRGRTCLPDPPHRPAPAQQSAQKSGQKSRRYEHQFDYSDPMPGIQPSLLASGPLAIHAGATWERIDLGEGAWVDVARDWLGGADQLCERLIGRVDWVHHRRWMYDRMVDEPRLTRWFGRDETLPDPMLEEYREAMTARYLPKTSAGFGPMGLNFYRDGSDSVAWHADRELKHLDDTLIAILTLGAERPFLLRPTGGGRSIDVRPASGDVLVMGGTSQLHWQHAVPKTSACPGPRISASIRWVARPP